MNFMEDVFKDIGKKYKINVLSANEVFVEEAKKIIEKYNMDVEFDSSMHHMLITGGDESTQRECNNELISLMEEINSSRSNSLL